METKTPDTGVKKGRQRLSFLRNLRSTDALTIFHRCRNCTAQSCNEEIKGRAWTIKGTSHGTTLSNRVK